MPKTMLSSVAAACLAHAYAQAADWPQLAHDAQRSGNTPDTMDIKLWDPHPFNPRNLPQGWPFKLVWGTEFWPERISRAAQPIVAEGKLFIGTRHGNFYALDATDGNVLWRVALGSPVPHTAAYDSGVVFTACLDGRIVALRAGDGVEKWTWNIRDNFPTLGFSTAPCLAEGKLFLGSRTGVFYAIDADTGATSWEYDSGAPILFSAAYDEGLVYCGNEDMYAFCLDAGTGNLVWESEKLWGRSLNRFFPVVTRDFVLCRPDVFQPDYRDPLYCDVERTKPWLPFFIYGVEDAVAPFAAELREGKMPDALRDKQLAWAAFLKENPRRNTLFVFDKKTGKQAGMFPNWFTGALSGPMPPPVLAEAGSNRIVLNMVLNGCAWGILDLDAGYITRPILLPGEKFGGAPDETVNLTLAGGDLLIAAHVMGGGNCQYSGVYSLSRKEWTGLHPYVDSIGGIVPGNENNEQFGCSVVVVDGVMYHKVCNYIFAKAPSEGEK